MADVYIDVPIVSDETAIRQAAIAVIQDEFPNWTPRPGSALNVLLDVISGMAAPAADIASDVPASIFQYYGPLVHIPPILATPASVLSTFTVKDSNGYTIPAFTPVGLFSSSIGGNPLPFQTLVDAVIAPGATSAIVQLVAMQPGSAGSGLDSVVRADSLGYVSSITLNDITTNGVDGEDTPTYLNRLSQELETLSPTPILGRDFALIALQVGGVYRVAYLDNYNPADGTYNNEKMVALSAIDANGAAVSAGIKSAIATLLESMREVNFVCNVVDPTVTSIDINYAAQAIVQSGYTAGAIQTLINSALTAFINPAAWGSASPAAGQSPIWTNQPIIKINKVVQVIENVVPLDWAEPVTMKITGAPTFAAADITLPGAFPLPTIGTITGTVTLP